ncbi:YuiA family protein [Streptomyces tibetensis]|uniref:YuiA family protein n=1 Tax=Streptomyces tibetensis TaxID=2382123 RepID=UPI0033E913D7
MHRPLDLRHVVSPGLRDLIELANTHDFDRVTEQVRNLRGCTSPVNLHGWTVTTDSTTEAVVRSYRSEDEPSGRRLTTCGNRRASRCPACSRVYAADTYHLIKAGLGMTQKALNSALRVSFAKVAEYQKRGLVHFHAVIRFDGPDGHTTAPPAWGTFDALQVAVGMAVERARLTVDSDAIGERLLKWGDRFKVDRISALGDGELTDAKVAGYVAKYATKNAEGARTVDRTLMCRPCHGRGYVRGPDGFRDLCDDCEGTGQAEPIKALPVQRHVRQMIRTAWDLGNLPEFAALKLWKWAHMLGFRGHFSSKSRAYSTTLGALRNVRRAWRLAQTEAARARAGLPANDENTTLVTASSWTYLSSGYRPGEELLAAQVRQDIAHTQRLKQEGLLPA